MYVCVSRQADKTFIKAGCYDEYTRANKVEFRWSFARNSESEKNERNDEVSKRRMYKIRLAGKWISRKKKKKRTSDNIQAKKCEDLNKIISPSQDKISLLLLLPKIVLKFINFHTHFAVRLPQQRFLFFFFFNYSYSVNYLKVRDTISVIIFICTIYLVFFLFHFITISRSLPTICNHSHHNPYHPSPPSPFSRYGWRRIVLWLATARNSFLRPGVHR